MVNQALNTLVQSVPGPIEKYLITQLESYLTAHGHASIIPIIDAFAGKIPWDIINSSIMTAMITFVPGGPAIAAILKTILSGYLSTGEINPVPVPVPVAE